jgi:hypothetical protein
MLKELATEFSRFIPKRRLGQVLIFRQAVLTYIKKSAGLAS